MDNCITWYLDTNKVQVMIPSSDPIDLLTVQKFSIINYLDIYIYIYNKYVVDTIVECDW